MDNPAAKGMSLRSYKLDKKESESSLKINIAILLINQYSYMVYFKICDNSYASCRTKHFSATVHTHVLVYVIS